MMPNIRDRFHVVDQIEPPDVFSDALRREPSGPTVDDEKRTGKAVVVAISLIVAIVAIGFVVLAFRSQFTSEPASPGPVAMENGDIWVHVGGGEMGAAMYRVDPQMRSNPVPMWTDSPNVFSGTEKAPELLADDYAFSPHGSQVVFSEQAYEGGGETPRELFVMNVDGSGLRQLTHDGAYAGFPAWSPDGKTIAYASYRGSAYITGCLGLSICPTDLYLVDANGGARSRLVTTAASETTPSWSPDGSMLAYAQLNQDGSSTIDTIQTDGSDQRELTPGGGVSFPSWSPDGSVIMFLKAQDGVNHIWTVTPDDTIAQDIANTNTDSNFGRPVWSPDGDLIAFARSYAGSTSLWTIDAAGNESPERIAGFPGFDATPIAWQPVPVVGAAALTVPNVVGMSEEKAKATLSELGLSTDVGREASDDVAPGRVISADPVAGTPVDPGSVVQLVVSDGAVPLQQVPGLDGEVCRLMTLSGDFGATGDQVAVFEDLRAPGAGCSGSEGFQRAAILKDGRVTSVSARLTDVFGDAAYRVWPFATPDLNGDGIDEVAVALSAVPGDATRVWFLTLSSDGSSINGILNAHSEPFTYLIGSGTDPLGTAREGSYGMYCDGNGGATRVATWRSGASSMSVPERVWRIEDSKAILESERGATGFLDSGSETLCGSPSSTRDHYPGQPAT